MQPRGIGMTTSNSLIDADTVIFVKKKAQKISTYKC